jgi:hypothetical protein
MITKTKVAKARQKSNRLFEKMTKAQKRVAIVKDALSQLRQEKISAGVMYYIRAQIPYGTSGEVSLQKLLPKLPPCHVCARGALFLSAVRKANQCLLQDCGYENCSQHANENDPHFLEINRKVERKFFSDEQIALIEMAYEGADIRRYFGWNLYKNDKAVSALSFYKDWKVYTAGDRLEAILLNLIENEGTFKP